MPEYYEEFRYMLQEDMLKAKEKILEIDKAFAKKFGREYGLLERYQTDDAEIILLTMGSLSGSLKEIVDEYRQHGERIGFVKLRTFRPFPAKELETELANTKAVAVLEKDISPGLSGALFTDLSAALVNAERSPLLLNFICGLAGRDISPLQIREAVKSAMEAAETGRVKKPVQWLGLRETLVGLR
ncbi:MAG TPA: hypothetical protein EYP46_00830 [Hadesarchaea archaeon]|nr:hypothetical protein [Hadesarchaea archaeon]